jgi:hypothetical protein
MLVFGACSDSSNGRPDGLDSSLAPTCMILELKLLGEYVSQHNLKATCQASFVDLCKKLGTL